ncbi:MAG: diguanylate cyclase [Chloroflexota bacterium]
MRSSSIPAPRSVRTAILCAFGVMIVILGLLIGGAVVTVKHYQSTTNQMQVRANIASHLQDAEANGAIAALLLQRYVVSGDAYLVPEIQLSSQEAVSALTTASDLESAAAPSETGALTSMEALSNSSATLLGNAQQVIQLVQTGQTAEAGRAIERIVPTFRDYRLQLIDMANAELAEVSRLQNAANSAGTTAMTLIIVSGIVGSIMALVVAFFVSRAIIRPLSKLEDTALSVALGDMTARAPTTGLRELKRLAESLNLMTSTARQRTEELRLSNEELRERNRQLLNARYEAATDPLTGLLNHRTFHEQIREAVADRLQNGGEVALIMVDIDNFKRVNDSLGHMAGDHVLREIGSTIAEIVGDRHAFRYGGDEFSILLPDRSRSEAISLADRLLKAVKTRVRSEDSTKATISLGVACFPDMAASAEELLYRSDMALNWAKSRGKNRVAGWDQVSEDNVVFANPQLSVVRGDRN